MKKQCFQNQILRLLKRFPKKGVTKHDIVKTVGTPNAGEFIRRLRKEGHNIECVMLVNPRTNNRYGTYFLRA